MTTNHAPHTEISDPMLPLAPEHPTKSYNLLWISPRVHLQGESFRQPIPQRTVENIRSIAKRNPNADVQLWVDSRRLTPAHRVWLEKMTTECPSNNLALIDLHTIPEYTAELLYTVPDNSPNWRFDKHSLIWRQVDTARLLACLQNHHDQVFYSDADITNLVIDSNEVQGKLRKHGVIVSGGVCATTGYPWYENGLFGFDSRKREFFRSLYDKTMNDVSLNRQNGYPSYIDQINTELKGKEQIDTRDIVFKAKYDGTVALPMISQPYEISSSPRQSRWDL